MSWAQRYHGTADHSLAGCCLGLVRRVQAEQFGKDFPGLLGLMHALAAKGIVIEGDPIDAAISHDCLPMRETKRLKDGTLVVCGNDNRTARHVGVYSREDDRVVHAEPDDGVVRIEPLWRLKLAWPVVRFFDVVVR